MITTSAFASVALLIPFGIVNDDPRVRPDEFLPVVRVEVKSTSPATNQEPRRQSVVPERMPPRPEGCFFDLSDPSYRCALQEFPDGDPPSGDLSPGDILTAAREVGMPALRLRIQPGGRTLVNVDTIFYTDPAHLRRTVTLLGHSVRLEAAPARYTWVHGDGTRDTTSRPGRPYPAKDVTHQYKQPDDNLRARVDTTYRVRYSVDGGGWADLAETLTAPGPATILDVDEATPVLTH
jgi:hypothetical protein